MTCECHAAADTSFDRTAGGSTLAENLNITDMVIKIIAVIMGVLVILFVLAVLVILHAALTDQLDDDVKADPEAFMDYYNRFEL